MLLGAAAFSWGFWSLAQSNQAAAQKEAVGSLNRKQAAAFVEITADAGISFRYERRERPLSIQRTMGPGVALSDFDGDGWLDLFLVGAEGATPGGVGKLLRNRGDGTFADATRESGIEQAGAWMGCAVGDVDNDGHPDLLLTGYRDCRLYRNLGSGRFADVTADSGLGLMSAYWTTSAAFSDVNRDGLLDLAIGAYVKAGPGTPEYCRDAGHDIPCPPDTYEAERSRLFLNAGRGRFRDVTARFGLGDSAGKTLGLAFADVNEDGFPDLYLANDEVPCDLYLNRKGASFANRGLASSTAYNFNGRTQAGMGVDWGDYNGDGRLDLVVTTFENEPFSLYDNDDRGLFTPSGFRSGVAIPTTPYIGWGTRFLDYDNDGQLDLFFANGHVRSNAAETKMQQPFHQPLLLFRGVPGGRFQSVQAGGDGWRAPMAARGVATGDTDNDGDTDLVIAAVDGSPRLLRNEVGHGRSWVGIQLIGRRSNRPAIGSRITVSSGGRTQVREVTTGGSYLSASDPRVLFGLGDASRVDYVELQWPSGIKQRIKHISPGKYYTYVEPENTPEGS